MSPVYRPYYTKAIKRMHASPVQSPPPGCSSSREEDSQDRHNTLRTVNEACSGLSFLQVILLCLSHMTGHVTDKSCQRSANCWERWHPEVISCHLLSTSSSQLTPTRKEHKQEDSVGWVYWSGEQDLRVWLFLSLGLNFALREGSVWHFCTGKLTE